MIRQFEDSLVDCTDITGLELGISHLFLIRKWKRACVEWRPALTALQELSQASDDETVARWTEEAEAADQARNTNPAAMDIYDVGTTPGELHWSAFGAYTGVMLWVCSTLSQRDPDNARTGRAC